VQHGGLIGSAVRISGQQVSQLGQLFAECATAVQPPAVQGFVVQSPLLNAYSFGMQEPQAIVLFSGLIEHLDEDELRFVIGHEMGHVLFRHTQVNSFVGGIGGVPGIPLVSELAGLALLGWSRCAEYSADRIGLLACGRLDKAQSAIVKLMSGPQMAASVSMDELERQAEQVRSDFLAALGQVGNAHPFAVLRLRELRRFAQSEAYDRLATQMGREEK
jgi:Zn-dependent protease with chaperone function